MVAVNPSRTSADRHCDDDTLHCLLDDTLSGEQVEAAEAHLSECEGCRGRLEAMVGDAGWWTETRDVYGEQAAPASAKTSVGSSVVEAGEETQTLSVIESRGAGIDRRDESMEAWLRTLLDSNALEGDSGIGLGMLERYRVDSIIGAGGMGVVVAAFDPQLSRPVAIKLLAPHLAGLGAARRRFAREARSAAAIVHPSIMPIYSVNESAHPPFLVMPLAGGGNLQERIDREGPLDLEEAIGIAAQIAEGLEAAHQRGVIHRDIKPGNILLEENHPRVLISDFGLARALDDATVTVSGIVAGTPSYMSPEQASGERVDSASDLFSLGGVLYAMLTGHAPFQAESPIAVLRKVIDSPVTPVSHRQESLPPWVDGLIARFLSKDPKRRIASAGEAAKLLRDVEAHLRNPSHFALPPELAKPPRVETQQRPRMIALVGLLVLLFAAWFLREGAGSSQTTHQAAAQIDAADSEVEDSEVPPVQAPTVQQLAQVVITERQDAGTEKTANVPMPVPNKSPWAVESLQVDDSSDESLTWQWKAFDAEAQSLRLELNRMESRSFGPQKEE